VMVTFYSEIPMEKIIIVKKTSIMAVPQMHVKLVVTFTDSLFTPPCYNPRLLHMLKVATYDFASLAI